MQRRIFMATGMVAGAGMATMGLTPTQQHFYVPPEEARHQRAFMQWPVNRRVHPDRVFLDMTQQTIADVANTIADFEPVTMLAHPDDHAGARRKLSSTVELWDIPTEDLWCRDAGPIFVIDGNGAIAVSHIQFNGWGEKQIDTRDSQIAARVATRLGLDLIPTGLRGEAGGVEQDGHRLLIAHESSWVNDNRNPGLSHADVETRLLRAYGADRLIWSDGVWGEDITDYHIDSLASFTGPGRVLINLPDDPDMRDPFHFAALDTHDALAAAGVEIEVIPEPNTAPRQRHRLRRVLRQLLRLQRRGHRRPVRRPTNRSHRQRRPAPPLSGPRHNHAQRRSFGRNGRWHPLRYAANASGLNGLPRNAAPRHVICG